MKRTIRGNRFRDSFGLGMLDVIPSAGGIIPPAIIRDGNTVAWYLSDDPNMVIKDGADRVSWLYDKANYAVTNIMDAGKGTFDIGTESWTAYGNNTIENDDGALKITYIDDAGGALIQLRNSKDLNTDLTIGKTYRYKVKAKKTGGGCLLQVGATTVQFITLTDIYEWHEIVFKCSNTIANYLRCAAMGVGNIIWIDEYYIEEIAGNHLSQTTGADKPLWSSDGILFDGVSEFMKTTTFTYDQPAQIYIVFRQVTWTSNDVICDGSTVSSGILEQNAITPELIIWAGAISPVNNNLALNTFGIIRILFNGGASTFEINETGQWVGNAGATNMSGFTLGSSSTGLDFSNIQVKEIILRKIADTAPNEQIIYDYLKDKYSL